MSNPQTLKPAANKVEVIGVLVENNLELRQLDVYKDGAKTGNKQTAITGDLVIRSGDNEDHTIRIKQNELTAGGLANKLYKGLVTIMNETVSITDTEQNPDATPSRLSVVGETNLNEYVGRDGEVRSFPSIKGVFINRVEPDDKIENKAEFDLDGMVGRVIDEFNREGLETGRKKVSLIVPMFNGSVIPIEFVVDAGKGADYIADNFENGKSVRVYGKIVNFKETIKKEIEMGFGENKVEESYKFVNELNIQGGTLYDEDTDSNRIINPEVVKAKLVEREVFLENMKTRATNREQSSNDQPKTGFGGNATPTTTPQPSGAGSGVDLTGLF